MTDALGKPAPSQLIELLASLDGSQHVDVDAIARALDPRKLRRDEFLVAMAHLARLAPTTIDLSTLRADTFARLISRASKTQLQDALSHPALRTRILAEIFRRLPTHLRAERTRTLHAVIHWRLISGDDHIRYETVINNGTCTVNREKTTTPRVTITLHPYDFLRLITSTASAPVLFMTGKLKIRGDLAFAASMMSLFDLPRA